MADSCKDAGGDYKNGAFGMGWCCNFTTFNPSTQKCTWRGIEDKTILERVK